jgi:NADH-quinone oxidoreductase subunit L
MLGRDVESRPVTQKLFTWINVGSFNVDASLLLDQLSISFVLLITGVGTLIHIYSISYMAHDPDRRRFFA